MTKNYFNSEQKNNKYEKIRLFFNGKKTEIDRIEVIKLTAKGYTLKGISKEITGISTSAIKKIWQEIADKEIKFFGGTKKEILQEIVEADTEELNKKKPKRAERKIEEFIAEGVERKTPKPAAINIYEYLSEIGFIEWYSGKGHFFEKAEYNLKVETYNQGIKNVLNKLNIKEEENEQFLKESESKTRLVAKTEFRKFYELNVEEYKDLLKKGVIVEEGFTNKLGECISEGFIDLEKEKNKKYEQKRINHYFNVHWH